MGESLESFKKQKKYLKNAHKYIHFFGTQTDCFGGGVGREAKKKT